MRVRQGTDDRRRLAIDGTLFSERFTVKDQPRGPMIVLWMDRRWRFVLTTGGLKNLGVGEDDIDMRGLQIDD